MKPLVKALLLLLSLCALLSACDDDAGVLKISIDTPTTEASVSTSESQLMIGGSVSYGGSAFWGGDVHATNLRTGRRYEADLSVGNENSRWNVLIPDLQPGDNEIVATVLSANDFRETRITIVRTQ